MADFLGRLTEGKILGQELKALPRQDAPVDNVFLLPPELSGDPSAPAAVAFVRENPEKTVIQYKSLWLDFNAERILNQIFGTQISLLQFLKEQQYRPVPLGELVRFHDEYQLKAGTSKYQILDYLNFLLACGVMNQEISDDGRFYSINENGLHFLSYIESNYKDLYKHRPF